MNRTTRILLAIAALTSLFTAPAFAAEPGFYLSATAGHAEEKPGRSIGANFAVGFPPVGIQHLDPSRVDVDNGALAWGAAVGYRVTPHVAAEVEYIDFGSTDISEHYDLSLPSTPILPHDFAISYSSRVKGPALSVLCSVPFGKAWDVFLRAGMLFADREIKARPTVGVDNGSTFGSTVWLAGAGANWYFASRWAVRAEYQRTGNLDSTIRAGSTRLERASLSVLFKL